MSPARALALTALVIVLGPVSAVAEAPDADAGAATRGSAGTQPGAPPADDWMAGLLAGLRYRSPGGDVHLRLGGRLLYDFAAFHYGKGLTRAPESGWVRDDIVRQARIVVRGLFLDRFELKGEVDFATDDFDSDDITLTDAYLGVRDVPWLGTVRFGHQKNPFSFENAMSRKFMVFMERSLIERLAPSGRDIGLLASNHAFDQRLRWSLGVFRSTARTGREWNEPASYLVDGRLTGLLFWQDDGRSLLHLGASYSHEFAPSGTFTFSLSQRPESFLPASLVATGKVPGIQTVDRLGGELVWVHGPFSLQTEAIGDFVSPEDAPSLQFWGASVMASWFATGEHRVYRRSAGLFGAVHPRRAFAPWRSWKSWGALQLGARFSHIDLNDRDVRGGVQSDVALAANWFLTSWLRVSGNYVFGHVRSEGDVHLLQGRLQFHF
jgi:phosphate-selective porin OprO/OprP